MAHESSADEAFLKPILVQSNMVQGGNPSIYQIPLTHTYSSADGRIRKYEYGIRSNVQEKTILLVGATGSGKTTFINSMVNYLFGVQFESDSRLKLIQEAMNANQAESQTKTITSYTIHKGPGSKIPFTLTIIDTPGFGDTGGFKKDEEIMGLIRTFFTSQIGIDHIDAIGFVSQSSLPRLTPTQRYIFDKILSLFGKDIEQNIMMLLTFADENEPQVLSGIKEAKFHYSHAFKFNNSVIYEKKQTADDKLSRRKAAANLLAYEMGEENFQEFIEAVMTYQTRSLTLTKEVLIERKHLEDRIIFIQKGIRIGVGKIDQVNREMYAILKLQGEIEQYKGFEIRSTIDVNEKHSRNYNSYSCNECEKTCQSDTYAFIEGIKTLLSKLNIVSDECNICGCKRSKHEVDKYEWVVVTKEVVKTLEEIKKKYDKGVEGKITKERLIAVMEADVEELKRKIVQSINDVRRIKARLEQIALKPNPLSSSDYIDLLIATEKSTASHGYIQRIAELEKIKVRADLLHKVTSTKDVPDLMTKD